MQFKDLFSFNSTERNGIILLLALIIGVSILPVIISDFLPVREHPPDSAFVREVAEFEKEISRSREDPSRNYEERSSYSRHEDKPPLTLFSFDPNTLDETGWRKLGLNGGQARSILKYLQKGGVFKDKKDLQKMYCLSSSDYSRLEPYISIVSLKTEADKAITHERKMKPEAVAIDLNQADSLMLLSVNGIGPSFAHRILRYRDLLGGFYSVDQLNEVYGFDEERFSKVSSGFIVNGEPFRKLKVNRMTFNELRKHPYMTPALAKALIDRRIIRGAFRSADELRTMSEIPSEQLQKLSHYISVE